jgi:hypothetical protein
MRPVMLDSASTRSYAAGRRADRSGDLLIVKDADLLRKLMRATGLSARQVSRELGWASHSYLNRILAGEVRTVRLETALRIAELLRVPADLVFGSHDGT